MKLTTEQNKHIIRYLREVNSLLASLPDVEREQAVDILRHAIHDRLNGQDGAQLRTPSDEEITLVFRALGPPTAQAAILAGRPRPATPVRDFWGSDRVWLGVCGALAERVGYAPGPVRLLTVLLGFFPPFIPVMLLAYMGWYVYVYHSDERADLPPIQYWPIAKTVLMTACVAILIYETGAWTIHGAKWAANTFADIELATSGNWGWLVVDGARMLWWVLAMLLPLAMLSRMPVPKPWADTLLKIAQASLCIYGMAVCFGIACYLVGVAFSLAPNISKLPDITLSF